MSSDNKQTTVQCYFPQKDMFVVEFLIKLTSLAEQYVLIHLNSGNKIINMYLISQIYFSFLLANDNMKALTLEIVSSRIITGKVIKANVAWNMVYFHPDENHKQAVSDITIMNMGGIYEFVYQYLNESKNFSVAWLMEKTLSNLMVAIGYEKNELSKLLSENVLSKQSIEEINTWLMQALLFEVNPATSGSANNVE